MTRILVVLFIIYSFGYTQEIPHEWLTKAERTNFIETARYEETLGFCRQLEKSSPLIKIISIGKSGEGRDIPLLIVSQDKIFNPEKVYKSSKTVVLIQNGIHAGEIEGKDASLMLVRDIVITKKYPHLLDNTILLILPIYNVDGHERFGANNRINQNGPAQMGWRTNATNLNLNRDYMKADAPETRAFLKMFNTWLPDFFIDVHTTNGADYQYALSYAIDNSENMQQGVRTWINENFIKNVFTNMETSGYPLVPYVWFRNNMELEKGIQGGVAPPRFSNGYTPLQNRPALLIETHMMKDYKTRVEGVYHFILTILENFHTDKGQLKKAVRHADAQTINGVTSPFPIRFETTSEADTIKFLGYKANVESSEISGMNWIRWTNEPLNIKIPWFNKTKVIAAIEPPVAYLIPQQWTTVLDILQIHGIEVERLKQPVEVDAEVYRFSNAKWQEKPYEGRHPANYGVEKFPEKRKYPVGTFIVRLNQRLAKVAIHLLEPEAPDALAYWGFFDSIFEQKEYAEAYVLEKLAREMLSENAELKKEFENKLISDTTFAKSPNARLNFFYQRSPYWDKEMNLYPVARVVSEAKFITEPVKN